MKKLPLVLDLLLDEQDIQRLQNSKPSYLYTPVSTSLYTKHIRHFDYHAPNLVISYSRDIHSIINLETGQRQDFFIDHQDLDETFSVAMGVTDHLAMIAIGDTYHTRLQVVDVNQPLNVFLKATYREDDAEFVPLPRYFTGNPSEAILVYSDNSHLRIDLDEFDIGTRQPAEVDQIVKPKTILDPHLSILGPFLILTITPDMDNDKLLPYAPLIRQAVASDWIAVDEKTLIHTGLVNTSDLDDIIDQRQTQIQKLEQILENIMMNTDLQSSSSHSTK